MGKQRKTWSPEVKEEIVLAVLSGEKSIAELARQHGVAENLIHNWVPSFWRRAVPASLVISRTTASRCWRRKTSV